MKLKRPIILVFTIITALLVISACDPGIFKPANPNTNEHDNTSGALGLDFSFRTATDAGYNVTSVTANLSHESGSGNLSNQFLTLDTANNRAYRSFNNMAAGLWTITVRVWDGQTEIASGSTTVNVLADQTATAQIVLSFTDGSGSTTVIVDTNYNFQPDSTDTTPMNVVDKFPIDGAVNVSPQSGITIFFNDIINPQSLSELSLSVTVGGDQVAGVYTLSLSANQQNAIISFSPNGGFPENSTVTVTMTASSTSGLLDKGNNTLLNSITFSFTTGSSVTGDSGNLGFESGLSGWSITGNGGVVDLPYHGLSLSGVKAAAISTGNITTDGLSGAPVDSRYSVLSSGNLTVPSGRQTLAFDYFFISDEFTEWIGSQFDDTVTVQVTGPLGSRTRVIESINKYTASDVTAISMPWAGSAHHTGFSIEEIPIADLGSPISVSITVSDVGDTAFPSMMLVDNFRFLW